MIYVLKFVLVWTFLLCGASVIGAYKMFKHERRAFDSVELASVSALCVVGCANLISAFLV